MLQIDWTQAPEWANFAAMDSDGEWWWYECEPRKSWRGDYCSRGQCEKFMSAFDGYLFTRPTSPTAPATLNNMDNY